MFPATKRQCPECGAVFQTKDNRKVFCCTQHAREWHNRAIVRGAMITPLLQAWRKGRHIKSADVEAKAAASKAFQEACAALDRYNQEDAEANRPQALKVIERRYRSQGVLGV